MQFSAGDVIEIETEAGLSYVQVTHLHPSYPEVVRTLPGKYQTRPKNLSDAVQGNTDFGSPGYGGPCPPAGSGNHHYAFTLFALKVEKLDLPANATAAFVGFNVMANSLGKAKLTGLYSRKK